MLGSSRRAPGQLPASPTAFPPVMESLDPRGRIIVTLLLSITFALSYGFLTLAVGLLAAIAATLFTHAGIGKSLRRLVPVNLMVLAVIALLPWTFDNVFDGGFDAVRFSPERLWLAVTIGLKANVMVLWTVVLLGGIDLITLGHALSHLRVPEKLIHLLLFSVRYQETLQGEYRRLRRAMSTRGFRPRADRHTYRTLGYLIGMMLVRSLDRAERIVAAMKCRGFRGRFYLLDHFRFSRRDACFAGWIAVFLSLVVWLEQT